MLTKRMVKNWILPVLTSLSFFPNEWSKTRFDHLAILPKWGQMLFDLNSETKFEILSSFAHFMTPFAKFLKFEFFGSLL